MKSITRLLISSAVNYKTLIVYFIVFGLLSLWPFDFIFLNSNNARLIETTGGLELSDNGQVLSISSTEDFYHRMISGSGLSLETWVSSNNVVQSGPARIITYSLNPYLRNFTLAQSEEKLIMRLRTTETDLNGTLPHLEVDIDCCYYRISATLFVVQTLFCFGFFIPYDGIVTRHRRRCIVAQKKQHSPI